jgi:hypothetical protein
MLFVIHWEVDFEKAQGHLMEAAQAIGKELSEHPEKYPKNVTDIYSYSGEPNKGFQVVEAESSEQLTRFALLSLPYIKCEVKPVEVEQTKIWFEYLK